MATHQLALAFAKPRASTSNLQQIQNRATHQIMPEQQRLLDAFVDGDYHRLLAEIERVEADTALNSKASRILGRRDWQPDATYLLAQVRHKDIRRVASNSLTQRPLAHVEAVLRNPYRVKAGHDPLIYINYICNRDGNGVPVHDYEQYLCTLEVAIGLKPSCARFAALRQSDVHSGINRAYQELTAGRKAKNFFGEFGKSDADRLKANVTEYVAVQRQTVVPLAQQQGVSHIAIHGEVGLSAKGYQRCKEHLDMLQSSPALFRLIRLVLRSTFQGAGFRLRQHVLFHVVRETQLAVGESIASLLCASYITSGGINIAQAGVQLGDGRKMTPDQWREALAQFNDLGVLKQIRPNLESFRQGIQAKIEQEQKQSAAITRNNELAEEKAQVDTLTSRLRDGVFKEEAVLQQSAHRLEEAREITAEVKQATERQLRGEQALEKFTAALQRLRPEDAAG